MASLNVGRRIGTAMKCRCELTITDMLSDSIVKAVMQSDGIDPQALEAQLRRMGQRISEARHAVKNEKGARARTAAGS